MRPKVKYKKLKQNEIDAKFKHNFIDKNFIEDQGEMAAREHAEQILRGGE